MMTPAFSSLRAILARPFPFMGESFRSSVMTAICFGAFVTLFLCLFPPMGLSEVPPPNLYLFSLIYGAICSVIMLCNVLAVMRLFRRSLAEERWTIGKNIALIVWNVLTIAAGNIAYTMYQFHFYFSLQTIVMLLGMTILIGIFPVIVLTLLQERRLLRRNINAASRISAHLHSPHTREQSSTTSNATVPYAPAPEPTQEGSPKKSNSLLSSPAYHLVFEGASTKERFETVAEAIICLQSSDNYVTIFALRGDNSDNEGDIQTALLRMTLKSVEERINSHERILRCHKSYIVNLDHVRDISGNAQGYKLHIPALNFPVPVSRSYQKRVLQALER